MAFNFQGQYQEKLMSAEKAVSLIPKQGNLCLGLAANGPPSLSAALAERARGGEIQSLHVHYQVAAEPVAPLFNLDLVDRLHLHPNFLTDLDRKLMKDAGTASVIDHNPCYLYQLPRTYTEYIHMHVFMITVSPMDRHGYFSLGTSNDYASAVARDCDILLLEVNENMPRVFGDNQIHISRVAAVVENHQPLIELPDRPLTTLDEIIGRRIAEMVPDRATLQLGIGGIPNACAKFMTAHKDLGVHTEMLTNGILDLYESGALTNKYKNLHRFKTVFTLCWGSRKLYDFIDDNPSVESFPAGHINDPCVIAANDRVVSINSVIEMDLFGQVNSEFVGGREFSGVGGQRDFISGAYRSNGGLSFLAFYSTAKAGTVSKIVPRIEGLLTETRMEPMWIVTEHGMCNLKGKSMCERALAMIELADPKFRDELLRAAKEMNVVK